jgi:hypothetical protein
VARGIIKAVEKAPPHVNLKSADTDFRSSSTPWRKAASSTNPGRENKATRKRRVLSPAPLGNTRLVHPRVNKDVGLEVPTKTHRTLQRDAQTNTTPNKQSLDS